MPATKFMLEYFRKKTEAAPLAVFRCLFGLMMFISIIRFWSKGWIEKLYILPKFHFHYHGFEWVTVPDQLTYLLFIIAGISALLVSVGWHYRANIIIFFLSFTYIELMDKTTYLNHYYFISVISFALIWLPAHHYFSIDAWRHSALRHQFIPKWSVDTIKILLAVVYIYAGVAKLNTDWMYHALPLSIWLPTKLQIPFLGEWLHERWLHYLFSWFGAFYDIFIVFFLLWKPTRWIAFGFVVLFHVLTSVLFPIGMFPYIMIVSTLIFFSSDFHKELISAVIGSKRKVFDNGLYLSSDKRSSYHFSKFIIIGLVVIQLVFPWRYLAYPGNIFWTEEGYRFSWRVMLMEKTGYAQFKVYNHQTKETFLVQNDDFLTSFQEKQMATQPDFIVEYAQMLGKHFKSQGHEEISIYVDSFAALNGRPSQRFIDPTVDLLAVRPTWKHQTYIQPLEQ